jgi:arylsulfatase A-like enzyme
MAAVLACGTSHAAIAAEPPAQSVNVHNAATTIAGKQDVAAPVGKAKPAGRATARRQPNIVFILLDDVRYDDIIDHPFAQLPNLARLRAEGTSFTRMFTSAPLCSPSRAAFLTGQYPLHNGIVDNGERAEQSHKIVTFPRLLHDAGYRTGFFGKWHMGHDDDTARPGFDRWVSFLGQGVYFDPLMNIDGARVQAKGYMTDLLTDEAISFIKKTPADRPFLAFISQKASHPEVYPNQVRTFPPAPGDEKLYEDAVLPRSPSWRAPVQGKPALARPVDACACSARSIEVSASCWKRCRPKAYWTKRSSS